MRTSTVLKAIQVLQAAREAISNGDKIDPYQRGTTAAECTITALDLRTELLVECPSLKMEIDNG